MRTMTESGRLLLEESHAIHSVTTKQTEIAKRMRPRVFTTCLDGLSILPFGAVRWYEHFVQPIAHWNWPWERWDGNSIRHWYQSLLSRA